MSEPEVLSDAEVERIILNFANTRGASQFTAEEAATAIKWAMDARLSQTLLTCVLQNKIRLDVQGGEVVFLAI